MRLQCFHRHLRHKSKKRFRQTSNFGRQTSESTTRNWIRSSGPLDSSFFPRRHFHRNSWLRGSPHDSEQRFGNYANFAAESGTSRSTGIHGPRYRLRPCFTVRLDLAGHINTRTLPKNQLFALHKMCSISLLYCIKLMKMSKWTPAFRIQLSQIFLNTTLNQ